MAKKTGRSASPEELEELNDLLQESPRHAYLQEVVGALKGNQDHLEQVIPGEEIALEGWSMLSGRIEAERTGVRGGLVRMMLVGRLRWPAVAAAVLILLVGGMGWYRGRLPSKQADLPVVGKQKEIVIEAGYGQRRKITLPDGTLVWLNAGSRLRYPEVFSVGRRDVELEGEAFFDVAKNGRAPFSVHAGKLRIGVLGTSFDVKAYKEDQAIETTLITGRVQVTLDNEPERAILLSPHEKLTVSQDMDGDDRQAEVVTGAGTGAVRKLNALRYEVQRLPGKVGNDFEETAWLNNKLEFNNETFEEVARSLERKYDMEIVFEDGHLKGERISGVFEGEGIERVLEILGMTTPFRYRVEGKKIYLSNK